MPPVPEAAHDPPAEAEQVQVTEVSLELIVSETGPPTTSQWALSVAAFAYDVGSPALTVSVPSVLVIDRSELKVIVSVSVAGSLEGRAGKEAGAVTVAVFTSEPVDEDFTVACTV